LANPLENSFVSIRPELANPGQGNLIETTFRQRIVSAMKVFSPNYTDWQVSVIYRAITATVIAKSHREKDPG